MRCRGREAEVGCGLGHVGCGLWDVGCGMWDVGCGGRGRWKRYLAEGGDDSKENPPCS